MCLVIAPQLAFSISNLKFHKQRTASRRAPLLLRSLI
ncbi:hypothetical protein BMETH_446_1 [methanotrophic bacterial endosymbiont of Bathymodiolus sp.]|nr:hypothetical protein BMETH_446_1 [methanotrophic bacterial endosymbiont of Bathymodiolus sp.]